MDTELNGNNGGSGVAAKVLARASDHLRFWSPVLRHGFLDRWVAPASYGSYRHALTRESTTRRTGAIPQVGAQWVRDRWPALDVAIVPAPANEFNVSWLELVTICAMVRASRPRILVEFGTFDGRTTAHLALNSPSDSKVMSFDIAEEVPLMVGSRSELIEVGAFLDNLADRSKIRLVHGDTAEYDFSEQEGRCDFVFVDADHSRAAVLRDSETAFALRAPGGIIVWHDYLMIDGVTTALEAVLKRQPLVHIAGTTLVVHLGTDPTASSSPFNVGVV